MIDEEEGVYLALDAALVRAQVLVRVALDGTDIPLPERSRKVARFIDEAGPPL